MATRAWIGISGWRYAPWRGEFYPPGLRERDELGFAAERFPTIELNGSFYSLQRPEYYARWYEQVPRDFVFAIKGSRYITHMLRLRGVETALANFFASGVLVLEHKLGPLLWQLPPTLPLDEQQLEEFLGLLPRTTKEAAKLARRHDERVNGRAHLRARSDLKLRHALEVRHPSFATPKLVELLRKQGVALVVADTAGRWPFLEDVTADFVYVRLHGDVKLYESGYTDAALERWAERIRAWRDGREPPSPKLVAAPPRRAKRRDVYVYFDNDIKVHAPYDAMNLAAKVEGMSHEEDHEELESQPHPLPQQTRLRPNA
ncbi:MAG: DUF72 domain-containing protein [Lysobacterales bacterium]|nr:MAG: DUF72 domain-containing protein [Xanthomonadales bacterium]